MTEPGATASGDNDSTPAPSYPPVAESAVGGDGLVCPASLARVQASSPCAAASAGTIVGGRYQIDILMGQRGELLRYHGQDLGSGQAKPLPIVILQHVLRSEPAPVIDPDLLSFETSDPDVGPLATDDPESLLADTKIDEAPAWPSIGWERRLLARTPHLSLPRALDSFREGGFEYMIEEAPIGRSLWDAWDEAPISWSRRCTWLIQVAEALDQLHSAGAILDGLRPDIIVVTPTSQAMFADLTGVLPLPVPTDAAIRGKFASAPELVQGSGMADARADLYSFGAMIQALLFGRELTDFDFTPQGSPRPYLDRDPDAHPMLGRILARTFVPDVECRFPSPDMFEADPTGFAELISTLRTCSRALDAIRLDVSAWTNTGVSRSGNEDAVAVLHSMEARLEACDDFTVIVLADGMGGMASGEVAAALTIQTVRDFFLRHPPFTDLLLKPAAIATPATATNEFPDLIDEALHEANRAVFDESRKIDTHRGMGCTAEVVLIDGRHVYIGHVGDSRVYHLRQGRITQITRDHTLVSQLVALGQLTESEAKCHPQRAELQQAIGGRRDVYPDHYRLQIDPGDWLLVCSDGLSNQLREQEMATILQAGGSAEKVARRLINHTIVNGALDNVTVVVVRAC